MNTVRACVSRIDEDSAGKFPLDVEVPLLKVSVLLFGVARRRIRSLVDGVLRNIRLWTASWHWNQRICQLPEWVLMCTGENVGRCRRKRTTICVECCRRCQPLVIAGEEVVGRTAD